MWPNWISDIGDLWAISAPPRDGFCPPTHSYAFDDKRKCCETYKDANDQPLTLDSTTCKSSSVEICPVENCYNNPRGATPFSLLLEAIRLYIYI